MEIMNKDYRKVIIAIVVIVVIAIATFLFYKQEANSPNAEEESSDVLVWINTARDKYGAGDVDGSIEFYLKALEVQPTNVVALNNLADIYSQKKEYEKSEEIYLKLIENTPKWINSYRLLMSIYKYHIPEKYQDMEQILLTGIEKTSDMSDYAPVDFYSMLGEFYRETGNIEKAIEYFEIVMKLLPDNGAVAAEIERLKELK